jgi:ABC-2 type transport system permease protein
VSSVARQDPWVRSLASYYATMMRTQLLMQFQYRASTYMYTLGMVAEPTIYLVVWSTIARSHGGTVAGLTPHAFAAYYIVWTLVRTMNIVFTPYGWEERIREGHFSSDLLRPLHPIHSDLAMFAGQKLVWVLMYLPIAIGLSLVFHPALHPGAVQVVVFFFAIWGAYLIRSMNMWILGMVSIWTTRAAAIFETYVLAELLLSGRLVPLTLMPQWSQTLAAWLPFKWTFYFPIEVLVGHMSNVALLRGLGLQVVWIAVGTLAMQGAWRLSLKHYTAVGN